LLLVEYKRLRVVGVKLDKRTLPVIARHEVATKTLGETVARQSRCEPTEQWP
jgi:hypothetical protein